MKIGNIDIKNNLFLAPMAGYTDVGFRKLCAKYGAGMTCTEMVSAKALMYDSAKTKDLLITSDEEKIKAVQIFGSDPEIMAAACKNPLLEKFDIIDINMGCPALKIVKNKEGSFLMTNIDLAGEIVRACVLSTKKPVTVKMRLGFDEVLALDFAKAMERAGASAITVHGRTKSQMYSGKVNFEEIARIKRAVEIPVIANGDVVDRLSYENMLKCTDADGVMIGRGALGNPWIFSDLLNKECDKNKLEAISEHITTLLSFYDKRYVTLNMRKHIAFYLKKEGATNQLKQRLMTEEDLDAVLQMLKEFFNNR